MLSSLSGRFWAGVVCGEGPCWLLVVRGPSFCCSIPCSGSLRCGCVSMYNARQPINIAGLEGGAGACRRYEAARRRMCVSCSLLTYFIPRCWYSLVSFIVCKVCHACMFSLMWVGSFLPLLFIVSICFLYVLVCISLLALFCLSLATVLLWLCFSVRLGSSLRVLSG